MSMSGVASARLMKELRGLMTKPPEGIRVFVNEANMSTVIADIDGPVDTPFAGGVFRCKLVLGADFPASPPKGFFVTKVFHPNVSAAGEICVNTLKKDWKPTHGLEHVLVVIRCLLIEPNPASALNEEAGKLLLEEYDSYFKRAQLMTRIHAKPGGATGASAPPATAKPADSKAATSTAAPASSTAAAPGATEKANTKASDSTEENKKIVIEKDNKENAAAAAASANTSVAATPVAAPGATVVPGAATSSSSVIKKPVAATAPGAKLAAAPAVSAAAAAANAKKKALKRL